MAGRQKKIISVGSSLILVVFIILALVTFAVMTAVTASADLKASENAAVRVRNSYAAANLAEEKLLKINDCLLAAYRESPEDFSERAAQTLKSIDDLEMEPEEAGGILCSFCIPVSETQELYVVLSVDGSPEPCKPLFSRIIWQERASEAWEADNGLQLIQ